MHKIVNIFLLTRVKFMPEMDLEQPTFTYCVCGPSNKTMGKYENFKKQ